MFKNKGNFFSLGRRKSDEKLIYRKVCCLQFASEEREKDAMLTSPKSNYEGTDKSFGALETN